jgi:methyl-accepting chemotaxis protein
MALTMIRDWTLAAKLRASFLLVIGLSLCVAGLAQWVLEVSAAESAAERQLTVVGRLLASQSTVAVSVGDAKESNELLGALKAEAQVVGAALYANQALLGRYVRGNGEGAFIPQRPPEDASRRRDGHLELTLPVLQEGRQIGALFLRSDMSESQAQIRRTLGTLGVSLVGAVVVASILSTILGRLLTRPVQDLAQRFRDIAEGQGDLTRRVDLPGQDEVGRLGTHFNTFLGKLQETVKTIGDNILAMGEASQKLNDISRTMNDDAGKVASQAGNVSSASEEISANIKAVAGSTESMNASIGEISRNAMGAATVATSAVKLAAQATSTLGRLGQSGAEINNVIRIITQIASQTNLLALNAAIEAARAGDAGRGFAVVASEVKDLAHATSKATEDIRVRIEAMQADMKAAGSSIVEIEQVIQKIHDSQNTIASAVAQQTTATMEITRTIQETAEGSGLITSHINTVAGAAQSASRSARATQDAAADLAKLALSLQQQVSQFRY